MCKSHTIISCSHERPNLLLLRDTNPNFVFRLGCHCTWNSAHRRRIAHGVPSKAASSSPCRREGWKLQMKQSTTKETLSWDSRATEYLASGALLIGLACGKRPNHSLCCPRLEWRMATADFMLVATGRSFPRIVHSRHHIDPCLVNISSWQDRPMGMVPRQPDWDPALAWKHRISLSHPIHPRTASPSVPDSEFPQLPLTTCPSSG